MGRYAFSSAQLTTLPKTTALAMPKLTIANAGVSIPEREIMNFTKFAASPTIVQEGEVFYRVHSPGRASGPWWTRVKPQSRIQFRIDAALRPEWNDATHLSTMVVPKNHGLQGWEGTASYQGGVFVGGANQLYIPNPPFEWISTVLF
jgi:hypothetical protein